MYEYLKNNPIPVSKQQDGKSVTSQVERQRELGIERRIKLPEAKRMVSQKLKVLDHCKKALEEQIKHVDEEREMAMAEMEELEAVGRRFRAAAAKRAKVAKEKKV